MEVKLFVDNECPGCPAARRACDGIANLSVYDMSDLSAAAQAHRLGVDQAPSVLVIDSAGREIAGWRGEAPDASEVRAVLAN